MPALDHTHEKSPGLPGTLKPADSDLLASHHAKQITQWRTTPTPSRGKMKEFTFKDDSGAKLKTLC
ncbi:MAG TPA: hypothetical protein PK129_04965 [Cellvibrionaceae bacterium]|nr:hypothetical protein [Cellvibrionaceae bacterium]